jgi:non-specific serine/threonine protein kinase/serine/threonine-protein kinase
MTREEWARVEGLFSDVRARPAAERHAWLQNACPDPDTRNLVAEMLAAHDAAPDFLEQPADLRPLVDTPLQSRRDQRFGAYRVVGEIGHGGMGVVYEASRDDDNFARRVAIKVLPSWLASAHAERFRRERRLLASLDHPGIARLLDAGEAADGALYFVMELVQGQTIDVWCRERHLDVRARVALVARVADAVAYAHQSLVIHRDLKPSNILVTIDGQPKLLDFGIATVVADAGEAEQTQTHLLTPAYASPEQIRGEAVTTASDVYSLGLLLFKLLTGRSPYANPATAPHALAREICEVEPPAMASVSVADGDERPLSVPRDLEAIVRKALRKQPSERYASIEQLAADLRRFLAGQPVQAVRGSTLYRIRKFTERNRWGIAAATTMVVLGGAGITEIVRQRQIAERRFDEVRGIANVVIFDVETAIAGLPGSTPARKLIMQRAMEYLDRLMREGVDSIPLRRDIALAYEKIGDVQGAPDRANLGEFEAAERNYRQALALREAIVSRTVQDADDGRKLARIHRTLGLFQANVRGDITGALQSARAALAVSERFAAQAPDDSQVLKELALDQQFLGELYSGGSAPVRGGTLADAATQYRQSRKNFERLLAATPRDEVLLHYAAIVDIQLADVAHQLGDTNTEGTALERSRRVLVDLAKNPSNDSARSNLAFVHGKLAGILLAEGKATAALDIYEKNLEEMRERLAKNPEDVHVQAAEVSARAEVGRARAVAGRLAEATDMLARAAADARALAERTGSTEFRLRSGLASAWGADALLRSGRFPAGRDLLLDALTTYEKAASGAPANVVIAISRSMVENKLGQVSLLLGDRASALRYCESAGRRMEPLRSDNPEVFDIDYALAESYSCIGDSHAGPAAKPWYEKSIAAWRRAPNPGPYSNSGFSLGSIVAVEGKLAALSQVS